MIIALVLCILFSFFLVVFVLSPLLSAQSKSQLISSFEGFNSQEELSKILILRDSLFQKLIYGKCSDKTIDQCSHEEALRGVVAICNRLQKANLPWEPKTVKEPEEDSFLSEKGSIRFHFLIYCFFITIGLFLFSAANASGELKAEVSNQDNVTAPSDVVIPPAYIITGTENWIPSVNQFILMPLQGKLYVYYVGMFTNNKSVKYAKIQIPLPKNFAELKINGNDQVVFEKSNLYDSAIVNLPLKEGINQLSAEFSLSALNGTVEWMSSDLKTLPGFSIFIMPEYNGTLRNLFSTINENINIWPPRIIKTPVDYKSFVGLDPFTNSESTKAKQQSHQLIRVGDENSPYPYFEIKGIVPQRTPLYILTLFVACFLFGMTTFFIIKTSK
ncbi:hypothetical protein [Fluviispira vulneris]|uniref:hypothetical protein n=1 Tax=Fluviispira vulneris TaxID=2763012 RepID=UPI0016453860|nr:hypothetical protein [Fluviispira vulneris]